MDDNGENGVHHQVVPVMTITVDPRGMVVTYKCTELPVYFWQMAVGEVVKQLEETRRAGAALALQEQLRQQAENTRVAAALRKTG